MAFNAREQRLTVVVLLLVGGWGSLSWGLDPLLQRADELEQQVEGQTAKLEKLSVLMASRSAVEREYGQVEPYLKSTMAQSLDPAVFLSELESLAREADVQINLKPRISKSREGERLAVELELRAPQERLFALIDLFLTMPHLVEIERLHLSPSPGSEGDLRAHLILAKLAFSP